MSLPKCCLVKGANQIKMDKNYSKLSKHDQSVPHSWPSHPYSKSTLKQRRIGNWSITSSKHKTKAHFALH